MAETVPRCRSANWRGASGFSVETPRYHERTDLSPAAPRDGASHRDHHPGLLDWLAFLGRLRVIGMACQNRLAYARLRAERPGAMPARRALLARHRGILRARIVEHSECLGLLDDQIAVCDAEVAS